MLHAPATRWVAASLVLIVVIGGLYVWSQVKPLLTSVKNDDVSYAVPSAPQLVAAPGETVYRIDPTQSKVTYEVDESVVGQSAGQASGSTSGIAGDLALNATNPAASRVGQIVVDVQQLKSDNSLRDARIRQDFLGSRDNPLVKFDTTSLSGMPASVSDGDSSSFTMNGNLTVKGRSNPISWDVQATHGDDQVKATATTTVKMSTLGIGPISLAGLVKTGDDVKLTLDLVALDPSKTTVPNQLASPVSSTVSSSGPSFKDDVAPILSANCAGCHNSGQVGADHWTLDTAGDAAKIANGIGSVTAARYMPPWPASTVGVPLAHSKAMSQSDIDTITAWSQGGGALDEPDTTPISATPNPNAVQPRHDVTLTMPEGYAGSLDTPNDYRCFVLDPQITEPTYITGYEVVPGQRPEIHHAQVFHIDAEQAAAGQQLSGQDGKPGWSCYSGPDLPGRGPASPVQGRKGFTGQANLIAGWVPGQDPSVYPENSGILLKPGDAIVLQMHYHYTSTPVPDQSTVYLQTQAYSSDVRPIDIINPVGPVEIPCMPGDTAPLCDRNAAIADDARLYGPFGAFVEPGLLAICRQDAAQMALNFAGIARSSCDTTVPESGQIVATMGHMHTLGKTFRLTLDPDKPSSQILLDIPTWNFDWQMNYEMQTPVHVTAGQTIRMECSWDRSLDPNRASKYIVFAEGTEDEMCFSTYAIIPDQSN